MDPKVAFLLLCHRDPEGVIAASRAFVAAGDRVAIHFDRRAPEAGFDRLREALGGLPGVAFAPRVACGWGEWSLVRATLNMARTALAAFPEASHFQLLSGDCAPTKTAAQLRRALAGHDRDWIEAADFHESGWIRTGLKEERLIYRHWFNEREQPRLFYASMALQRRLGLTRRAPEGLRIRIGSQWWLLRRRTLERVIGFLEARPDVRRFFRTAWIPDEILFQSVVPHLVPPDEIVAEPPTTLLFSDYGQPVVFHADLEGMLKAEPRFFARKATAHDRAFRARLFDHYVSGTEEPVGPPVLARRHAFVAARGREGRLHGERFWRRGMVLGDDRELLVVAAKKWHLGREAAEAAARAAGCPSLGYVFDDEAPPPVDLGGIERRREARSRHRRAFLGLAFAALGTDRLALCLDPSRDDAARDLCQTEARVHFLFLDSPFDEAELAAHAGRIGLLGAGATPAQRAAVIEALRADFAEEARRLRRAAAGRLSWIAPGQDPADRLGALARFLRAGPEPVAALARSLALLPLGETHALRL